MSNAELLERAENYIAEFAIDLWEMRSDGTPRDIERECTCELSGMQRLMSYLYRTLEEEEV